MLTLILAECALETIPRRLWKHPLIEHYAKKRGKLPQFLLLDRSYHHGAMKNLADSMKRGRPDIVHFALLEALGSPLNKQSLLKIHVHTVDDAVIDVNPDARLPRNYNRFVGLLEQLFQLGTVPPTGDVLLRLERKTLSQLLRETEPGYVLAFSTKGSPETVEDAVARLKAKENPAVIVGGFPHGHFLERTVKQADEVVCVDREMLEAWTLTSRVIYDYERAISLPRKRLADLRGP